MGDWRAACNPSATAPPCGFRLDVVLGISICPQAPEWMRSPDCAAGSRRNTTPPISPLSTIPTCSGSEQTSLPMRSRWNPSLLACSLSQPPHLFAAAIQLHFTLPSSVLPFQEIPAAHAWNRLRNNIKNTFLVEFTIETKLWHCRKKKKMACTRGLQLSGLEHVAFQCRLSDPQTPILARSHERPTCRNFLTLLGQPLFTRIAWTGAS